MSELIDSRTLIRSLRSTICPACGGRKMPRHTLCGGDYRALSKQLQYRLYDRIGSGYAEAFRDAMASLSVASPHWPPQAPS